MGTSAYLRSLFAASVAFALLLCAACGRSDVDVVTIYITDGAPPGTGSSGGDDGSGPGTATSSGTGSSGTASTSSSGVMPAGTTSSGSSGGPLDMLPPPGGCDPGCAGCCDANGACVETITDQTCGAGASACVDCTVLGKACFGGVCVKPPGCGPSNCKGCCEALVCLEGSADSSCGVGGQACQNCAASGLICVRVAQSGVTSAARCR